MNKREVTRLMNRAVKAFNEGSASFQSIMDDATVYLSDDQWEELERIIDEAGKKPALPETPKQEQERLEATVNMLRAQLDEAERQLYAFYARKHAKKTEVSK